MSTTSTLADDASSPPSLSPSPPPLSSTPAATPTSLTDILPITLASLSAPGPIILSLPAPTLEPCPIPTSPFEISSSITISSTPTTSESSTTNAVGESPTGIPLASVSAPTLAPCSIPMSPFAFSSSITTSSTSTTSESSTTNAVGESTVAYSIVQNTQVYTTTVAFTTTMPGTMVTGQPRHTGYSRTNMGAIVGGGVGGVGGLIILTLLVVFCSLNRRKDKFDEIFDPAYVKGGGSGTLPKIDLGEDGLMGNNGVEVDEDDGMGGRLGPGPGCGGIISPYPFQLAPVSGSAVGGQQRQNQLQMKRMSNIRVAADGVRAALAAGCPNKKRAMRQQYILHTPNQPISSESFPSSSYSTLHLNPNSVSPESHSVFTSDGSSSLGGSGRGGIYYQLMRGPSPGLSVLKQLSPSSGRGNSNEMEAMGVVISNPDDGHGQSRAFQQAYLPTASGHRQQHQCLPSSSPAVIPSRAGKVVVVHDDGGRIVFRKGEEAEGKGEVMSPEILPNYDSLPVDVRRDS